MVTYCPLVLAWAATIHKFQGFEAGFDPNDTINFIIANLGGLDWEKLNPGTAYVVASRAKTLGMVTDGVPYPINSNLFFEGQIGRTRFTDVLYKENKTKCLGVAKRDAWVEYLESRATQTKFKRSKDNMATTKAFILDQIQNHPMNDAFHLSECIVQMLTQPNEAWKQRRKHYMNI